MVPLLVRGRLRLVEERNMKDEKVKEDSLWSWFWYRMFHGQGFPWLGFLVAMLVGGLLVGMVMLVALLLGSIGSV